jgi:protein-S-isoprenylcysteine O-methyltransferase Ste14
MSRSLADQVVLGSWLALGLLLAVTFVRARRARRGPETGRRSDHRSMAGLLLEALGVAVILSTDNPAPAEWCLWTACLLAPASAWFAWRASVELGRHFRAQAIVTDDHELMTTGPYSVVRHPIYAGILGLAIATGLARASWTRLALGVVMFCLGTEIRVRVEESLLRERFPEALRDYQRRVKAYIPFVR